MLARIDELRREVANGQVLGSGDVRLGVWIEWWVGHVGSDKSPRTAAHDKSRHTGCEVVVAVPIRFVQGDVVGVLAVISRGNDGLFVTPEADVQEDGINRLAEPGRRDRGDARRHGGITAILVPPTIKRTKSGRGAVVIINESDQALTERQPRRRERLARDGDRLKFTPGQLALLQRRKTAHS